MNNVSVAPEISVIMGVYNERDKNRLFSAINSILKQTISNIELIIHNDGSIPEVKKYLDEISKRDKRIRVLHEADNKGLAYALNNCIRRARGRYIARMDSDDIASEERLVKQKAFLDNNPQYDWCGTNAKLFDDDGVWGSRCMPRVPENNDYLKYSPFIHPSVMFRKEVFDGEINYKTKEETLRCEDYELFMRLHRKGYRGANIQDELFLYREDRESYERRTLKSRINEAKVRYHSFKEMNMLFPYGWIYAIRPVVGAFVPVSFIRKIKRSEFGL